VCRPRVVCAWTTGVRAARASVACSPCTWVPELRVFVGSCAGFPGIPVFVFIADSHDMLFYCCPS
jgi:hypothetical protein